MKSFFVAIFLFSFAAHSESVILGPTQNIGEGQASSFVKMDETKVITSLGLVFSGKSLQGLPDSKGHDYEYNLDLPEGVSAPPFDHFTMNWNPHGHVPDEIYGVPHFDFHFYFITKHEQHMIPCDGTDDATCMKQPPAEYIPPFYISGPGGVPMMGWHWVDFRSPEFHGQPFTTTYIYGFYNGEMIFLEPMIARSFLQTKPQFTKEVPLPKSVAKPGNYPANYSLMYDSVQDLYWLSLEKLTELKNSPL
ncbi:DUF5602 domain-containing protein [Bdellovibrio sp. ZAP7]|uniref:DUF5602 domain-containing protein n=1 Tax=Bdellovibrio sp. ZAP7 TaxID=2231053 RepID=UPI00143CFFE2|nr:DUF5602 domain-containing protein [Bdellovibrio sp. ZAP7]